MNERQQRFCEEYVVDLCATAAAIRAGYSARTAYSAGSRLLKNLAVRARVDELLHRRRERTQVDAARVLEELVSILDVDVGDFFDEAGDLRRPADIPSKAIRALTSVETDPETGRLRGLRLVDRLRTIELLGKHLGVRAWATRDEGSDLPTLVIRDLASSEVRRPAEASDA